MAASIVVPAHLWAEVHDHVLSPGHYAFLLAGIGRTETGVRLTVNEVIPIRVDQHTWDDENRDIDLETLLGVINRAKKAGMALIDVHSHAWPGAVSFSITDRRGIADFAAYMLEAMPGIPYAAIVVNDECAEAVWYPEPDERRTDIRVCIEGAAHRVLDQRPGGTGRPVDERYARQVDGFLGKAGQAKLRGATVAIVGTSGLGSPMAQQLAYLGVGHLILIEPERIDKTNLNRLVGAGVADLGLYKVDVLKRELERIRGPDLKVSIVKADVRDPRARRALVGADLVIGCVDNDGARLILNRYALAHGLPYFDAASGIESPEGQFDYAGGHVAAVLPGGPCYNCMGLLDAAEARYFLKPKHEQAQDRKLGYARGWDEPSPSVVSLNGVVASATVTEVMCYLTGFTAPNPLTMYYLRDRETGFQRMTRRHTKADPDCVSCQNAGIGDAIPPC